MSLYQKKDKSLWKHLDFIIFDLFVIEGSFLLATGIRNGIAYIVHNPKNYLMTAVLFLIHLLLAIFGHYYQDILRRGHLVELKMVVIQNLMLLVTVSTFLFLTKQQQYYSRLALVGSICCSTILIYGERISWKNVLRKRMQEGENAPHLLVVTDYANAAACIRKLSSKQYPAYRMIGLVIYDRPMCGNIIEKKKVLANRDDMLEYTRNHVVDEVLLNIPAPESEIKKMVDHFLEMGVTVHLNINWNREQLPNSCVEWMGDCTVLTTCIKTATQAQVLAKRSMDIVGSLLGIVITAVLFMILAPVIYVESPGPVLFSQIRVGKNGRKFRIYKFRSMYMDAESRKKELMHQNKMKGLMFKMDDDPRITPVGKFMRKHSLDEFPQFWNVLKGEMSLVGTRPPTVDEYEQYDYHHKVRLSIKPGITGLWQVSGRSDITDFERVVELDNTYIREWNLRLDIKILFRTIGAVLKSRGSV